MGAGLAPWVYGLAPAVFLALIGCGLNCSTSRLRDLGRLGSLSIAIAVARLASRLCLPRQNCGIPLRWILHTEDGNRAARRVIRSLRNFQIVRILQAIATTTVVISPSLTMPAVSSAFWAY
jgi:hypothetical protein